MMAGGRSLKLELGKDSGSEAAMNCKPTVLVKMPAQWAQLLNSTLASMLPCDLNCQYSEATTPTICEVHKQLVLDLTHCAACADMVYKHASLQSPPHIGVRIQSFLIAQLC